MAGFNDRCNYAYSWRNPRRTLEFHQGAKHAAGNAARWVAEIGRSVHRADMSEMWMTKSGGRNAICAVLLLAAFVVSGCVTNDEVASRNEELFDELVFGSAYDNDLHQNKRLVKWQGDVRVAFRGTNVDTHRRDFTKALKRVLAWAGISLHVQSEVGDDTNYVVEFIPDKLYRVRNDYVPCSVHVRDREGVIYAVRVRISVHDPALVSVCNAHEIMHSLGFRFHSGIARSILSPIHGEKDFTAWDELMIRVLYDQKLKPGLSRQETMPIARKLVRDKLSEFKRDE